MLIFYRRRARRHKGVIALAHAPRNRQRIACDPTRLVRRQEHRDRRYIVRLSGPPERRPRHSLLLVIIADDAHRMCTLSIDQARLDLAHPDAPARQLGSALGIAVAGSIIVDASPAHLAQASRPGWLLVAGCGLLVLVVTLVAPAATGHRKPQVGGQSAGGRRTAEVQVAGRLGGG